MNNGEMMVAGEKPTYLEKKPQCLFVDHNFHVD
jgi:hypothetical protein